jgi:hypothetical protein
MYIDNGKTDIDIDIEYNIYNYITFVYISI